MQESPPQARDLGRNYYRFDHWLRNRKWWWSIFFWSIGVIIVNSYVLYVKVNLAAGKRRKDLLSHHDYNKSVALDWIKGVAENRMKRPTSANKRKEPSGVKTRSAKTPKKQRTAFVNDAAVGVGGSLQCRLDSTLDHLPEVAKLHARCCVHRWAANIETTKAMLYCATCNVTLCSECYKLFHVEKDLLGLKEELKNAMESTKPTNGDVTTPRNTKTPTKTTLLLSISKRT